MVQNINTTYTRQNYNIQNTSTQVLVCIHTSISM